MLMENLTNLEAPSELELFMENLDNIGMVSSEG